jgi:hypothetical protein
MDEMGYLEKVMCLGCFSARSREPVPVLVTRSQARPILQDLATHAKDRSEVSAGGLVPANGHLSIALPGFAIPALLGAVQGRGNWGGYL